MFRRACMLTCATAASPAVALRCSPREHDCANRNFFGLEEEVLSP